MEINFNVDLRNLQRYGYIPTRYYNQINGLSAQQNYNNYKMKHRHYNIVDKNAIQDTLITQEDQLVIESALSGFIDQTIDDLLKKL